MTQETTPSDTETQRPRPSRNERHAVQVTLATLEETLHKPVPEILADLRRLAAADE